MTVILKRISIQSHSINSRQMSCVAYMFLPLVGFVYFGYEGYMITLADTPIFGQNIQSISSADVKRLMTVLLSM